MSDLKDYSGALKENLKLQDFSQEFLAKLAKEWQAQFIKFEDICFHMVQEKWGQQAADEFELEAFARAAKINVPRIAKLANTQVRDAVDFTKVSQLLVEGLFLQPTTSIEVINRDHVKLTVRRCVLLDYLEKHEPSRIIPVCHQLEVAMFTEYIRVLLPDFKANALKLPPRKSPTEVACVWEWVRSS
ncbi:MAG: hypothetical protein PHV74_12595 [Dehalococcoidia bacterium]|nr:hypothetical protein [Dehalococcoidia bacterium]